MEDSPPLNLFTHYPLIDVWVCRLVATVNSATVTTALKAHLTQPQALGCLEDLLCAWPAPWVALSKFCLWVEGGGIFVLWIQKSKEIKQTDPESPLLKAEAAPA